MLKVTIEIIPWGKKQFTRKLAKIQIINDGTGTTEQGNYRVMAEGETIGGWDTFFDGVAKNIRRGDYIHTVLKCLDVIGG